MLASCHQDSPKMSNLPIRSTYKAPTHNAYFFGICICFVWKYLCVCVCMCVAESPKCIINCVHCEQHLVFCAVTVTVVEVTPVALTWAPWCLQGTASWQPRSVCSCGRRPWQTPWSRRRTDRPPTIRSTLSSMTGSVSGSASRSPTPASLSLPRLRLC